MDWIDILEVLGVLIPLALLILGKPKGGQEAKEYGFLVLAIVVAFLAAGALVLLFLAS